MNLLIGVSGGIAVYKACELVSLAQKAGHAVRVMMTPNATHFVGPLTFRALTGQPVLTDTFGGNEASAIDHVAWAKWAERVILAPATANLIGKMACGIADDAVTTIVLAVPQATPIIVAPAMNTEMWRSPIVQRNLRWLTETGQFRLVEPVEKRLACGDVGVGALADPAAILESAVGR